MCGICGVIGVQDEELVRGMADLLRHRGPDDAGVVSWAGEQGGIAGTIGHRRLSIIDPTPRGRGPMVSEDGRLILTFNGEIYNYRELREQLGHRGFRFRTDTDTEVLLTLYAAEGPEMLMRLNGMFAFAIWDRETRELFLARDRLGIKPLYYTESGPGFAFASEIKALVPVLPERRLRLDVLPQFLTFLWVPDPDTLLEGVYKLPPGHCATYGAAGLQTRQWWDLTFAPEERPDADWFEALGDEVRGAVRRQLVADVPLGAFLSGGIDSSAVVAEMAESTPRPAAFTVGFTEADLGYEPVSDDLQYAEQVAARYDAQHTIRVLEPDVVRALPRVVWHLDDLVADPAAITTLLICEAASDSLTVVLSGMGGDEIFAGYPRYAAARIGRALDRIPHQIRRSLQDGLTPRLTLGPPGRLRGARRDLAKLARGLAADATTRHLIYSSYYTDDELNHLLAPGTRMNLPGEQFARHDEYFERVQDEHWLNQLLYVDMKTFLPCLNLAYTDRMSMAASTEVRVPLLDDELVEFAGRIPPRLKLHRGKRKYAFKKSMEPFLPANIIWRPKAGFGAPVRAWLINDLKPLIDELLSVDQIERRGLFEASEVRRLISDNDAGRADNALRIWALLVLELWMRTFIDPSSADRVVPLPDLPAEFAHRGRD